VIQLTPGDIPVLAVAVEKWTVEALSKIGRQGMM
jgi:hypothetical protein